MNFEVDSQPRSLVTLRNNPFDGHASAATPLSQPRAGWQQGDRVGDSPGPSVRDPRRRSSRNSSHLDHPLSYQSIRDLHSKPAAATAPSGSASLLGYSTASRTRDPWTRPPTGECVPTYDSLQNHNPHFLPEQAFPDSPPIGRPHRVFSSAELTAIEAELDNDAQMAEEDMAIMDESLREGLEKGEEMDRALKDIQRVRLVCEALCEKVKGEMDEDVPPEYELEGYSDVGGYLQV